MDKTCQAVKYASRQKAGKDKNHITEGNHIIKDRYPSQGASYVLWITTESSWRVWPVQSPYKKADELANPKKG